MQAVNTHTHTHTGVVAGRHSASHPVVSLHASELFSVTQILIWKSQMTELTERESSPPSAPSPLFSLSSPSLLPLLHRQPLMLLILILCPFNTGSGRGRTWPPWRTRESADVPAPDGEERMRTQVLGIIFIPEASAGETMATME